MQFHSIVGTSTAESKRYGNDSIQNGRSHSRFLGVCRSDELPFEVSRTRNTVTECGLKRGLCSVTGAIQGGSLTGAGGF